MQRHSNFFAISYHITDENNFFIFIELTLILFKPIRIYSRLINNSIPNQSTTYRQSSLLLLKKETSLTNTTGNVVVKYLLFLGIGLSLCS